MVASDSFLGFSTLGLAVATFILAGVAIWQLKEARREREAAARSLSIAEATFQAEQRPELIALHEPAGERREIVLHGGGWVFRKPGQVLAETTEDNGGVVSFDALNIGRGAAEITRVRLMSLDTLWQGGEPAFWEPDLPARRLIVVPAGGTASVDLVLPPEAPDWFDRHMQSGNKFWAEVVYRDLGSVEEHVRWFEFRRRREAEPEWFIGQILRLMPRQFSNLPSGSALASPPSGNEGSS